jgi:hypothetical protein
VVTAEHALDVAIEDRERVVPGLAEDRTGGAAADAGQGMQRIEIARQVAVVQFHAALGGGMQVACAGVVAEPGPLRHHRVIAGGGEVGQGREVLQEPLEVRDDRGTWVCCSMISDSQTR